MHSDDHLSYIEFSDEDDAPPPEDDVSDLVVKGTYPTSNAVGGASLAYWGKGEEAPASCYTDDTEMVYTEELPTKRGRFSETIDLTSTCSPPPPPGS